MGLIKGVLIVSISYYSVQYFWDHKLNPMPEEQKKNGLLYFILFIVFLLEIILTF
jgi:hypothetical protein